METIRNKVAESGIITFDLTTLMPGNNETAIFDIKPFLFREMILKEKEYRTHLQDADWQIFTGKHVAIFCSADAIIPVWAYMLAASYLQPLAATIYFGKEEEMKQALLLKRIEEINTNEFADKRVVIKGCADVAVPDAAYVAITHKLQPAVKSLMYGEPCSTVPVYKKKS